MKIKKKIEGWLKKERLTDNAEFTGLYREYQDAKKQYSEAREKLKQAKASAAPEDVIKRIQGLIDSINRTRPLADDALKKMLAHKAAVTQTFKRVNDTKMTIKSARDVVVAKLVARDDAPIWSADVREQSAQAVAAGQNSFRNQLSALRVYVTKDRDMLLAHAVTGDRPPWADLFDAGRLDVARAPGAFVSLNAKVGWHLVADRLHTLRGEPPSLEDGEGAVYRSGLVDLTAVSRVDGATCAVSGVCPHLGGTLRWNPAERSWDCPLHGSRFGPDGAVLEGPATCGLSRAD
jgi:nitrite reductase/ring-hydroxylating ferredoxin subunit